MSSVRCEIFDGDEHAAFVEAVRRNVSQGLPLRLPERQRAASPPFVNSRGVVGPNDRFDLWTLTDVRT